MTDQFRLDNYEPNTPQYQKIAGNYALEQLRGTLPSDLISINGFLPNGIFKPSDGQTEVGRILISTQINLLSLTDPANLDRLQNSLRSISTNPELSDSLVDFVNRVRFIRSLLLPNGNKLFYKGFISTRSGNHEDISLTEIVQFIKQYSELDISEESEESIVYKLSLLFNSEDRIEVSDLNRLVNGEISFPIPLVYKRITGGEDALMREINFYKLLSEKQFHTLCALNIMPLATDSDQYGNKGTYEFTLEEEDIITFREDARLFDPDNKILLTFFQELARLHNLKFFHGDPHFENIGYKIDKNGHIIIIFDLVRASIQGDPEVSQRRLDFDLSIVISNISKSLSDTKSSSDIEEKNEAIDYVSRCYHTYIDSLAESGTFSQENIEATRQTLAQAIVEHKILLAID